MSNEQTVGGDGGATLPSGGALSRRDLLAGMSAASAGVTVLSGYTLASPLGGSLGTDAGPAIDGVDVTTDEVWVETAVDTNDSGDPDRIQVRVTRDEETNGEGVEHPIIAVASPYYGDQDHGDTTEEMLFDRTAAPQASDGGGGGEDGGERASASTMDPSGPRHQPAMADARATPGHLAHRYVPKGYAVAKISSLGTAESTGCYTAAGPPTTEALRAVIDWFNGRGTAYDAPDGGEEVAPAWTNGRTGMIGTSANGELANAAATTGVDGLETVVPQAANIGQYSLFRANGTPISVVPSTSERMMDLSSWVAASNAKRPDCDHWTTTVKAGQDHATGDYNDFWHERTFLTDADDVEASVLLTHAVDDPIVKPNNVADWYETLSAHDAPVRLWLHEGGHTSARGEAWVDLLDRWWAYWLKDADNDVMDEDPVTVVRGDPTGGSTEFETASTWPVPDSEPTTVGFGPGGAGTGEVLVDDDAEQATESLVDDPGIRPQELVDAEASDHRLRFETGPLSGPVRLSGRVVPSLSLSLDEPTVVSVALVEYHDSGSDVVTRGWADPLNRPSYSDYDTPLAYKQSLRESAPLDSGEQIRVEFPLQATDHVFEAGSRIGLVVYASDTEFTLHPPDNAELTLSLGDTSVDLPVVGGVETLSGALPDRSGEQTATTEPTNSTADGTATQASTATETDTERPSEPTAEGASEATDSGGETTSDGGPGFGVVGTLTALAGGSGLLKRRSDDDE